MSVGLLPRSVLKSILGKLGTVFSKETGKLKKKKKRKFRFYIVSRVTILFRVYVTLVLWTVGGGGRVGAPQDKKERFQE